MEMPYKSKYHNLISQIFEERPILHGWEIELNLGLQQSYHFEKLKNL